MMERMELTDEMYDLTYYNKLLKLEAAGHKLTPDEIFEHAPRDVYITDSEKPSKITTGNEDKLQKTLK